MKLRSLSFLLALKRTLILDVQKRFKEMQGRRLAGTKNSSPYLVTILLWLHRRKNVALNGQ